MNAETNIEINFGTGFFLNYSESLKYLFTNYQIINPNSINVNIELEKTLQDLVEFGDTQKQATDITRDAIKTMRDNLDELERLSKDVQDDTAEFVAVTADTMDEKKTEKKTVKAASKSIFKGI